MSNLPVYRLLVPSTDANRTTPRSLYLRKSTRLEAKAGMVVVEIGTLPDLVATARKRWGDSGASMVMDAAVIVQSYRARHHAGKDARQHQPG